MTHFIIQICEFSELPKNKFSPLVQQWHSESLRQKRFYLELDLWGKYSWYIDTVDTLREIQLKHSGKYSWYRGRSDCILRWDLCGSGQARISCITDRCSQRYALVNLWLQLYLARPSLFAWNHLLVWVPPTRARPEHLAANWYQGKTPSSYEKSCIHVSQHEFLWYQCNTHKCHVVHTKCSKHRAKFRQKVPTYLSMQIGIW